MSKGPIYRFAKSLAPNWAKGIYHRAKGRINRTRSTSDVFAEIYQSKQWGSAGEFHSGAGTADKGVANPYFKAIQKTLEARGLINTRFVDLGCGDFRIGAEIAPMASAYIGGDVVPALVEHLNCNHGDDRITFRVVDMVKDELPDGEVCFIRQVLQHLSNEQISKILPKLAKYRCVFVTEHIPNRTSSYKANIDKAQGPDIRLYWNSGVFLDQPPFSIPPDRLEEVLTVPGTSVWKGEDPGEIVTWAYLPARSPA